MKTEKQVVVLGLGETGLASALFLKRWGYEVFVTDCQRNETLEERSRKLREAGIAFELGGHSFGKIAAAQWAVISPGIPPSSEIYRFLLERKTPVMSEVEVASWFSPGEVIAVTGTSGKSTTVTLLARLLRANGLASLACGNLGNPWIGEVEGLKPESTIVLELSSFQLLHTYSLKPRIGILLNIGLNHLDWHPALEDYVDAKLRLFQNQTADDAALIRRSDQDTIFPRYRFNGHVVYWGGKTSKDSVEELLTEVSRLMDLDPAKVREVLDQFEGLEHRLEKVSEVGEVQFVNDSKCTTLEALLWALDRFPDQRIILLAGGHAKGADFRSVRARLSEKVKQAVLFGEARHLLEESWTGAVPLTSANNLSEAFRMACRCAVPGDIVLLSPACASFDQFTNYQERGRLFKQLVKECLETERGRSAPAFDFSPH